MNNSTAPSQLPVPDSLWDIVDAAIVINLDHRVDRWEKIREHLKLIVPLEKLHRVSAVPGKNLPGYQTSRWFRRTKRPETWAGRAGCSVSHRNAMRMAIDKGWNWVLMMEDDAHFVSELDGEFGQRLASFLRTNGQTFGFMYLGFDSPNPPHSSHLRRRWRSRDLSNRRSKYGACVSGQSGCDETTPARIPSV